jgi:hypothetical protein
MRTSILGAAAVLFVGCASQPPARPTAIDPSNPAAQESPAPVLTPLVGPGAAASSPPPASTPPAAADHGGHEHGASGAPAAPDATVPAEPAPGASGMEHGHDHAKKKPRSKDAMIYTCPMHPEVTSPKPGQCPKCEMKLVPKPAGADSGEKQ